VKLEAIRKAAEEEKLRKTVTADNGKRRRLVIKEFGI
jgi:hypothetical protein